MANAGWSSDMQYPALRLRRLRQSLPMRNLVRETRLSVHDLVQPLFVSPEAASTMPRDLPEARPLTLEALVDEAVTLRALKIPAVLLFGLATHKDPQGSSACEASSILARAIPVLKAAVPELLVMVDLCLCGYTDHGHCGVLDTSEATVDNDATLALLAEQAICLARAGADVIAPSGMMDGMVGAIRKALDTAGYIQTPILSYSVKYHSAFYGPFRDAMKSRPNQGEGDRSSYQMDPANAAEALREAGLDLAEGADMLMVKPAHTYLDIVYRIKQQYPEVPLAAYHVSGECAMLSDLAQIQEVTTAIKRAGADIIITYAAKRLASHWNTRE